jgi:negative regulator of sigma E activity
MSSATQALSGTDVTQVADDVNGEEVENAADEAADDAQEVAEDAAETAQVASWWAFVGLLIGAAIASAAGALGVTSVSTQERTERRSITSSR